ncbi:hypothetical protein ACFC1R_25980 [Kitasatospora sp. NPDC056138]|uniref:hypothetical protein n=1 Tax=Kitasatospora sp. NPDC056138 TaxID=3345724 RepID=UPI0035DF1EE2
MALIRTARWTIVTAAVAALTAAGTAATAAAPSDSDLLLVRLDPDPAPPGGDTTVHAVVANGGPDRTASPISVVIALPAGFTAHGPYFPSSCTVSAVGHLVRCTFPPGLRYGQVATALIPARVDPAVPPGTTAEGQIVAFGPDDRDPADNRAPIGFRVSRAGTGRSQRSHR